MCAHFASDMHDIEASATSLISGAPCIDRRAIVSVSGAMDSPSLYVEHRRRLHLDERLSFDFLALLAPTFGL